MFVFLGPFGIFTAALRTSYWKAVRVLLEHEAARPAHIKDLILVNVFHSHNVTASRPYKEFGYSGTLLP